MRTITSFGLLALIVSMVFSGIPISVEAQADPSILLKIALQAQKQIETQISNQQVSDEVQKLFEEGSAEVDSLKDSLENDDISSARNHFLSAMKIFKKISQMILERPTIEAVTSVSITTHSLSSDLERVIKFLSKLKAIAEKHDSGVDFSEIERLVSITKSNIHDGNFDEAKKNIVQIKHLISDIKTTLVAQANESKTARAKDFAQKHLEKLANFIEKVKKLEGIDPSQIQEAERILSEVKNLLSDGNTDEAFKLLRTLNELVKKLRS